MRSLFFIIGLMGFLSIGCQHKSTEDSSNLVEIQADSVAGVPLDTLAIHDNSETSLDWDGTYKGILPCEDCKGVDAELTLKKDKTYVLKTNYLGKNTPKVKEAKGVFSWDETGSVIQLNHSIGDSFKYKVGENYLIQLDAKGNAIEGKLASNYILEKMK